MLPRPFLFCLIHFYPACTSAFLSHRTPAVVSKSRYTPTLPEEIPLSYSLTDVAALTRWYLKGYPVRVHTRDDGLFVLASPKDSVAKYALELDTATIYRLSSYLAAYLICGLLARQKAAPEKQDNARTEWIAGVSHDIRPPLSLILGHADSLATSPFLDKAGRRETLQIQKNSLRIRDLIADLNLTSKLAALIPCAWLSALRPSFYGTWPPNI